MIKHGRLFIGLGAIFLLSLSTLLSCTNSSTAHQEPRQYSEPAGVRNTHEDYAKLAEKYVSLKEETDREREVMQETLNMAFHIFAAMSNADYEYLESVLSSGLTLDPSNETIRFRYGGDSITVPFIKDMNLSNLDFRASILKEEGRSELALAKVENEMAVEIYVRFIKEDGIWKWDGFITN